MQVLFLAVVVPRSYTMKALQNPAVWEMTIQRDGNSCLRFCLCAGDVRMGVCVCVFVLFCLFLGFLFLFLCFCVCCCYCFCLLGPVL